MPTCNYISANTVSDTQQAAMCKVNTYGLTDTGLDTIPFKVLVLDLLERLGIGPAISAIDMCDAEQVLRDATCAMNILTILGDLDPQKLDALILYKLNEEGCAS